MALKIIAEEKGTAKPIPFIMIYVEKVGWARSDDTDSEGVAEFTIPEDDNYMVKARSPDHRPYTKRHFLSRNSILELSLHPAY